MVNRCIFEMDWTQEQFISEVWTNWQMGKIQLLPWEMPVWLLDGIGHVGHVRSLMEPNK